MLLVILKGDEVDGTKRKCKKNNQKEFRINLLNGKDTIICLVVWLMKKTV